MFGIRVDPVVQTSHSRASRGSSVTGASERNFTEVPLSSSFLFIQENQVRRIFNQCLKLFDLLLLTVVNHWHHETICSRSGRAPCLRCKRELIALLVII